MSLLPNLMRGLSDTKDVIKPLTVDFWDGKCMAYVN